LNHGLDHRFRIQSENEDLLLIEPSGSFIRIRSPNRRTARRKGEDFLPCDLFSGKGFEPRLQFELTANPRRKVFVEIKDPVLPVGPPAGPFFRANDIKRLDQATRITEGHHLLGKPHAHLANGLNGPLRRKELDLGFFPCINQRDDENVDE
jgi:hypothetical protein